MAKIKTALGGLRGSKLTTALGEVSFDTEGVAEVTDEIRSHLLENFPDAYADINDETPTPNSGSHVDPKDDPAVKAFATNHSAQKTAERNGAAAQVVTSTTKDQEVSGTGLLDAQGNKIESSETEKVEEKPAETEEKSEEPVSEDEQKVIDMLTQLSVTDIHETLVQSQVQDDETAKITDKEQLIAIAAKKLA